MARPIIHIFGTDIDFGKETLTEKIHKIIEEDQRQRGVTIERPELVFYNPDNAAEKAAIEAIMAETTAGNLVIVPEKKAPSPMEMLDRLFAEKPMDKLMLTIQPGMESDFNLLGLKKTGFERANPNQPFYAKFGKRQKFGNQNKDRRR